MPSNNSRQQILDAAYQLFIANGYQATGTKDIAREAEVNKAMIHYYFDTKENLFREVCRKAISETFVEADALLAEPTSLFDKLRGYIDRIYDTVRSKSDLHRFLISELNLNNRLISELFLEATDSDLSAFKEQVERAADKYEIARVDYRVLLMNIHALCVYPFMMQQWYFADERLPETYKGDEGASRHKQMIADVIFTWLTN